jgi:HlyD family secretion protein
MFPVIISLDNSEGYLKPGMNGEVSMLVDRREGVLAVTNDAVRTVREAATAAAVVGLNPDSVTASVQAQQAQMRAGGGNGGGAGRGTDAAATRGVDAAGKAEARTAEAGTAGAGTSRRSGGSAAGGGRRDGGSLNSGSRTGGSRTAGGAMGAGMAGGSPGGSPIRPRTALVFVQDAGGKFVPRIVRLGASNYDYSEVLSGLQEGDKVATLNVGMLQQKRDQQNDRFRSMTGGGMPGMCAPGGGGAAGGARGGAAGGAAGGGAGGGGARPPSGGR